MKRWLILPLLAVLVFSGCASTLTSQNIRPFQPQSTPLSIGFNPNDVNMTEAPTLAPYTDNFHYVILSESNGQINKTGPMDLQLSARLTYSSEKFEPNIILGTASMVIPFLSFIPESNDVDYFVDYTLKNRTGAVIYQNKLKGRVEGNVSGYWIGRLVAAQDLEVKQGKFVMENAARMIINDLNINNRRIAQLEKSVTYAAATPAPSTTPIRNADPAASDIDDISVKTVKTNPSACAIVIGLEKYRQKLPPADYAVHDARTVSEYLTKVLGYPEENVVTLTDDHAALGDFVKYFEKWLPNNVEKDGTVFIYYSGHGAPDPATGNAYLVPYDADPSFIAETGYPLKRLYTALEKLPAKSVVVALDSCFSGAGGRSVIAKGARPLVMNLKDTPIPSKTLTVLSASAGNQTSSTYDEKNHGLFTYFMLKGIRNEDVVNPDGSLKIDDLFGYLRPQVERIARKQFNNEQTPQLFGKN